jgi:crotonobetainyl-CoA:carnitine CoA-transferase CaiB-like acyl-CoA transferase
MRDGEVKFMNGALDGARVIDLRRVLGGPYCTQVLGDGGADVIEVEPPAGDETHRVSHPLTLKVADSNRLAPKCRKSFLARAELCLAIPGRRVELAYRQSA